MEISRKTDYALRILSVLIKRPEEIVSVRDAAESCDVPYSFARSIQHSLVNAGIIASTRGSRGGMTLAIDPDATTLLTVVEAVQGPVLISDCESAGPDNTPCPRKPSCFFNPVWCNAEKILRTYFASITLSQIVKEGLVPEPNGGFKLMKNETELRLEEIQDQVEDIVASTRNAGQIG